MDLLNELSELNKKKEELSEKIHRLKRYNEEDFRLYAESSSERYHPINLDYHDLREVYQFMINQQQNKLNDLDNQISKIEIQIKQINEMSQFYVQNEIKPVYEERLGVSSIIKRDFLFLLYFFSVLVGCSLVVFIPIKLFI